MSRFSKLPGLLLLVVTLLIIELLARSEFVDPRFIPPPTKIIKVFSQAILSGDLLKHMAFTLARTLVGYLIAMLLAIPLGILMGESKFIFNAFEPIVETLRPLPSAAVIPVAIILLGIGDNMRIAVIIFGALWPTIISTIDSVRSVDSVLIDTGRTLNLTRIQIIKTIVIPAAAPGIATGMRISLAIALILDVTVEMITGGTGLGFFIIDSERSFQYPEMFAGIIAAGILGYAINTFFVLVERWALGWHLGLMDRER